MISLEQDIFLDDTALTTAFDSMKDLSVRTQALKEKMEQMYEDLVTALQTPCGEAFKTTAKEVLIKPIDDLKLIVDHISETLELIKGVGYYRDVFDKYEELNQNIKVAE